MATTDLVDEHEYDDETKEKILEKDITHLAACGIDRIIQRLVSCKKPIKQTLELCKDKTIEFTMQTENQQITVKIEPLKRERKR